MTKKCKDKDLKDDEKSRLLAEQLQADRRQSKLPAAKKWESNYKKQKKSKRRSREDNPESDEAVFQLDTSKHKRPSRRALLLREIVDFHFTRVAFSIAVLHIAVQFILDFGVIAANTFLATIRVVTVIVVTLNILVYHFRNIPSSNILLTLIFAQYISAIALGTTVILVYCSASAPIFSFNSFAGQYIAAEVGVQSPC
ncbi:hypothetical protein GN958_ATG07354 [Phytophthora infestans]|uniref:Transmembrane protein n=1 Tax=Phytophthora infestans TaxID=4787 RepID=A0A8S9UUS4_PHYIN|nr:hypothetical protein GN958_ATG07354 [Phytophthora infestans]